MAAHWLPAMQANSTRSTRENMFARLQMINQFALV